MLFYAKRGDAIACVYIVFLKLYGTAVVGNKKSVFSRPLAQMLMQRVAVMGKMVNVLYGIPVYGAYILKYGKHSVDVVKAHMCTAVAYGYIHVRAVHAYHIKAYIVCFDIFKYFVIEISGIVGVKYRFFAAYNIYQRLSPGHMPCGEGSYRIFPCAEGLKSLYRC